MSFYLLAIKTIVYYLFIQLFRLGIAVNAIFFSLLFIDQPRFQANVPSMNLVSKQMHYQIEGILLASS